MRLAAIALTLLCGTAAYAADIPAALPTKAMPYTPVLPTNWNRLYIGINGGYGWNTTGVNVNDGVSSIDIGSVPHGVLGGAQIGIDQQINEYIVIGVIADIDGANLRSSGQALGVIDVNNLSNYMGTLDARVGFTIGNHSLAFVEGGLAYGGNKPNFRVQSLQAAAADTSVGWNVGGGIETKLTAFRGWSAFVKGGFMDLGSKSLTLDTGGGALLTSSNPLQFGYGKIGLNYAIIGQ
jgi:outer membrane immunogenic protein